MRRCLAILLTLVPLALAAHAAEALESVTLQLKWKHQFQFAGYYAALEKGYYRDAGLDVRIVEAEKDTDPVGQVSGGHAQYGVGNSELLLRRQRGEPVVVLAVILQHSPLALIVRKDSGIAFIHDLAGKAVMVEPDSAELLAYLEREGLDKRKVRLAEHRLDISTLVRGEVSAMSAYITDEPDELERLGIPYALFLPSSAGIDFYGDNLFTTEGEIQNHPERVKAFREASLRGWAYAMQNPEEIARLIHDRYSPRHSVEHLRAEASQMRQLMRPDLIEPGHMHEGRWRHIAETYRELGLVGSEMSLDGFLYGDYLKRDSERLSSRLKYLSILLALMGGICFQVLRLHRRRRIGESQLADIIDTVPVALVISDAERCIGTWNRQAEEIFGWDSTDVIGRPLLDILVPADRQSEVEQALGEVLRDGRAVLTRGENLRRDGTTVTCEWRHAPFSDGDGSPLVISMAIDVTERIRTEQRLHRLAHTDPLTGIANRTAFFDRFTQAMATARRYQERFAVLFIDLNDFKNVNDTCGHEAGDVVLKEVAGRLRSLVRESDTVARMGGDEFVVLLPNLGDRADAEVVAAKISAELEQPFVSAAFAHRIGSSIGIAVFPDDGETAEALLHKADHAMYQAKGRSLPPDSRDFPTENSSPAYKEIVLA